MEYNVSAREFEYREYNIEDVAELFSETIENKSTAFF